MNPDRSLTVALLLSCESFESFFQGVLQLDRDKYLKNYRNDFAWYYSMGLIENGVRPDPLHPVYPVRRESMRRTLESACAFFASLPGTGH